MVNNKNKIIIEFLIIFGIIIIVIGTYLLYLSNPKRVFAKAINNIATETEKIFDYDNDIDDYTFTNNIDIKTNTENLSKYIKDTKDKDYIDTLEKLNKINNLVATLSLTSNKTKKEMFIKYNTTKDEKEIIRGKFLVKNNTEYYFVKDVTKTYINNGSNDYYESINSNTK